MIKMDIFEYLVTHGPGRTALQLARAVNGDEADQSYANQDLELLRAVERVIRRGAGGPGQPFRYYPVGKHLT